MNMLKQRRDNFQCGGKDELNLKLTFFIMASFFRNLEVLNPGIKEFKPFSFFLAGVYKNTFMRNDISNIILYDVII